MQIKKGYCIETAIVNDESGIHARPSALLVLECKDYPRNVYLKCINPHQRKRVTCKYFSGPISLEAEYGSRIRVYVEGTNEEAKKLCSNLKKILAMTLEEITEKLANKK